MRADYAFAPAISALEPASSQLTDIDHVSATRRVAVGERGLIIYSRDGGASWSQAKVPVSVTLTAVDFPSADLGWAVGHSGVILHSRDGGQSWELQFDGRQAAKQWQAFTAMERARLADQVEAVDLAGDPDGLLADLEYTLEDAVFAEEDAADAINTGPADPFLDVLFVDEKHGWAVGAYGMIYRTDDAGQNWALAAGSLENPDRYHYYGLAAGQDGQLYLSGEAGLLYWSHNRGATWERVSDLYEGSLFGVVAQAEVVTAFGLRGNIFRSLDYGVTWSPLGEPGGYSLYGGALLPDGRLALVGAGGAVMTQDPGQDTFSVVSHPGRATFSAVTTNPEGQLVMVGMAGVQRLEESTDGR